MTIRHTARAVLCVLFLSGCERAGRSAQGAGTDTTPAADSSVANAYHGPKACDLVSADDVSRIAGVTYQAGVVTNDYMGDSQCQLAAPDTARHPTVMVTLHAQGNMEPYRRVPGVSPVGNFGDEAIWNPQANQLAIRRGAAVLSVSLVGSSARKQQALALGRIALARLDSVAAP